MSHQTFLTHLSHYSPPDPVHRLCGPGRSVRPRRHPVRPGLPGSSQGEARASGSLLRRPPLPLCRHHRRRRGRIFDAGVEVTFSKCSLCPISRFVLAFE